MGTVQGIVRRPDGSAWPDAKVQIRLLGPGMQPDGSVTAGIAEGLTNPAGFVSFNLPGNNAGEFYVWHNPDGSEVQFGPVPSSGTYALTSLVTHVVPTYQAAVTAAQLDAAVAEAVAEAVAGLDLSGGGGGGDGSASVVATDLGGCRISVTGTGVQDLGGCVVRLTSPDLIIDGEAA